MTSRLYRIGQIVPSSNSIMETEIEPFYRAFGDFLGRPV
jgi:maleate cis-trans isomerase